MKPVETQLGMDELNVRLGMAIALRTWYEAALGAVIIGAPPAAPPAAPPRGLAYGSVADYAAACIRNLEWQTTWVSLQLAQGRVHVVPA